MGDNEIGYATLTYDIDSSAQHYMAFESVLRRKLRHLTLSDTKSSRLMRLAQADTIRNYIEEIVKRYGVGIVYRLRRLHPDDHEIHRQDATHALIVQIKSVKTKLLRRVEKLESELRDHKVGGEAFRAAQKNEFDKAEIALREARGLALLFMIGRDVEDALGSLDKIVRAREIVKELKGERS